MKDPKNEPTSESFLAVGVAILDGINSPEYQETRNPMQCWRNVLSLVRNEPNDEKAAQLIQAVSESLNCDLRPGTAKPEQRVA